MQLSKNKMYIGLHAIFIISVLLYQSLWLFSERVDGTILNFGDTSNYFEDYTDAGTLIVRYTVNRQSYERTYTRNETPFSQTNIPIRYLTLYPGYSRLDTFVGNWLMFIIIYVIFFLFTTMLWLLPNDIVPRGTIFLLNKSRPWIKIT